MCDCVCQHSESLEEFLTWPVIAGIVVIVALIIALAWWSGKRMFG